MRGCFRERALRSRSRSKIFIKIMVTSPVFHPSSLFSRATVDLLNVTFIIAAVIMAVVTAGIIFFILRFKGRQDQPEPRQYHGNRTLEITWTAIPFLILVCLMVFTVRAMNIGDPPVNKYPDIVVIGHQFWWEVRYPGSGVVTANEIHIPAGKPLLFQL